MFEAVIKKLDALVYHMETSSAMNLGNARIKSEIEEMKKAIEVLRNYEDV